jgi:hypothetical protein
MHGRVLILDSLVVENIGFMHEKEKEKMKLR